METQQFHVEQLMCLMNNFPIEPGDTLSHELMRELFACGLASRDEKGRWNPTKLAYEVYRNLLQSKLQLDHFVTHGNKPTT